MINLKDLGTRICIIGCSNSGKSTLAEFLSKNLSIQAHHLDQYAHIENSNWQRSSNEVLINAHDKIIKEESWIIDGNYSICMEQRFNRATSIIWLDPSPITSAYRYICRSIRNDNTRPGRLSGAKTDFNFWLIKHILFTYPKNRIRYEKLLKSKNKLLLKITSMSELKKYYAYWEI